MTPYEQGFYTFLKVAGVFRGSLDDLGRARQYLTKTLSDDSAYGALGDARAAGRKAKDDKGYMDSEAFLRILEAQKGVEAHKALEQTGFDALGRTGLRGLGLGAAGLGINHMTNSGE
jgi:hypothetical protein